MKCVVCSKFADRIRRRKCFSQMWADGTESIKKDSLEKHINGEPYQFAESLPFKELLGPSYHEKVVSKTQIRRGINKIQEGDKQVRLPVIAFLFLFQNKP